jgi:hypothetical protein
LFTSLLHDPITTVPLQWIQKFSAVFAISIAMLGLYLIPLKLDRYRQIFGNFPFRFQVARGLSMSMSHSMCRIQSGCFSAGLNWRADCAFTFSTCSIGKWKRWPPRISRIIFLYIAFRFRGSDRVRRYALSAGGKSGRNRLPQSHLKANVITSWQSCGLFFQKTEDVVGLLFFLQIVSPSNFWSDLKKSCEEGFCLH